MKPLSKKQYKTIRKWIKINYSLLCEESLLGLFDFHFKPKPQTVWEKLQEIKTRSLEMKRRLNEAQLDPVPITDEKLERMGLEQNPCFIKGTYSMPCRNYIITSINSEGSRNVERIYGTDTVFIARVFGIGQLTMLYYALTRRNLRE